MKTNENMFARTRLTDLRIDRLIDVDTPFYMDASVTSLDHFKQMAIDDFEFRIIKVLRDVEYAESSDEEKHKLTTLSKENLKRIKPMIGTVGFYDIVKEYGFITHNPLRFPLYRFCISPKNISFTTLITDLRYQFKERSIIPAQQNEGTNLKDGEKEPVGLASNARTLNEVANWQGLFGGGEFPFMKIWVFRLGNTEYYAYTIHR